MHIAMSTLEPSAPLAYFASASGIYKHRRGGLASTSIACTLASGMQRSRAWCGTPS